MKKYFHFITQINGRDLTLKVIKSWNPLEWAYSIIFWTHEDHILYDTKVRSSDNDLGISRPWSSVKRSFVFDINLRPLTRHYFLFEYKLYKVLRWRPPTDSFRIKIELLFTDVFRFKSIWYNPKNNSGPRISFLEIRSPQVDSRANRGFNVPSTMRNGQIGDVWNPNFGLFQFE